MTRGFMARLMVTRDALLGTDEAARAAPDGPNGRRSMLDQVYL